MSHLAAICDAIDFVEDNLKEEVTVAAMADAASYSLYHFCRTFNRVVHHTPYDYLMRRRLSESARALRETDKRIIDVAFEYRFNSPETYSRAFKRMFGVQPSQWRERTGAVDRRVLMSRLTPTHLAHYNQGERLGPALEERGTIHLVGVMTVDGGDPDGVTTLWRMLERILGETALEAGARYGVTHYPPDWESTGRLYMAAVEVPSPDVPDGGLVTKMLPPARYARFAHRGGRQALGLTRDYIYQTWLARSGERLAQEIELERFTVSCENESTVFSGPLDSQDSLYDILNRLHSLGLELVSVSPVEPDLEEVFVRVLDRDATG